jgi:hypothetical protein
VPGQVFVSYSRHDAEYVRRLVDFLRHSGFDVWSDEGIDVGTQWVDVVRGKIDTCAAFVLIMTPDSERSTWVARELERANARAKPILPMLLAGSPFDSLRGTQFESVVGGTGPSARFVEQLRSLTTPPGPDTLAVTARDALRQLPGVLAQAPAVLGSLVSPPRPVTPGRATPGQRKPAGLGLTVPALQPLPRWAEIFSWLLPVLAIAEQFVPLAVLAVVRSDSYNSRTSPVAVLLIILAVMTLVRRRWSRNRFIGMVAGLVSGLVYPLLGFTHEPLVVTVPVLAVETAAIGILVVTGFIGMIRVFRLALAGQL